MRDTDLDFRMARPIRSTSLDTAFTDLDRDASGRVEVLLRDPVADEGVALWMDAKHSYVQVFTGDELPVHARESLAVEPMTAPRRVQQRRGPRGAGARRVGRRRALRFLGHPRALSVSLPGR